MKEHVLLAFAVAACVCPAATTYNLSNGSVSVPANSTAIITQSNTGTATGNRITIGSGATVTLSGVNILTSWPDAAITCSGSATIILADGKVNTVDGTTEPGVKFTGNSNNTVVIKGESSGTGKLTAKGSPGIGSTSTSSGCNLIIESGVINAVGQEGFYGNCGIGTDEASGYTCKIGNITIKGGTINASGGTGIGSCSGVCGTITISGGNVTAKATRGCGIGAEDGCRIVITGGTVVASAISSGNVYAGVGIGSICDGCDITISGGTVKSVGSTCGIGTRDDYDGSVTITKGIEKVTAVHSNATVNASSARPIGGNLTLSIDPVLKDEISSDKKTRTLSIPYYTITWKNDNGTTLKTTKNVRYGAIPVYDGATPTKASTAQYSYTFKGWSPTVVAATANKTYTATYTSNVRSYNITWKNGDGSTLKTDSLLYGSMPVYEGDTPTKATTGEYTYIFDGWYPEFASVTSNATYSAKFTEVAFKPVITPASGTTFEGSLSVSMSCATEGATIHYTTNGVDPTAESPEYRRFRVYGKTTVKAIAEKDGLLSDVVTAEYALGRCVDPVISLADGTEFAHSNQVVSIRWKKDGVLRYTLDGTDPTAESPIYEGPFAFSDSVELRAKVFSDEYFDSAVVTSRLTRVWENVATPVIDAAASFTGSKTKVVITCATKDVTIRYTLNGNDPNSHSTKYTGPFYVTDSCTVKAYAVMTDYLNSAVATQEIVKVWGIGDSLGKPDHGFTTNGSAGAGWVPVVDAAAPNGEAMKSGAITHNQYSVLETTVMGSGTLTFSWRTSCEDSGGAYDWDHVEFAVDGTVLLKRDGINVWESESVVISGEGEHTVTWTYMKDDVEGDGDDAAYVAGYGWASDLTETQTTQVHVPYAWLLMHDPEIVDEYDAYEAAAKVTGANGHKVWESYVIGADPNDKDDSLKITAFNMKDDGTPDLDAIEISPAQSRWNVQGATLRKVGKATLEGAGEWQPVTEENKAGMRFFKVKVVLP